MLDVKRLRRNSPRAVNEVERKIIQVEDSIDPDPGFNKRLRGRREVDEKDFLVPWRIFRLGRGVRGENLSVFGGGKDTQVAIPKSVQLRSGCEYLIEAVDVRIEHRVKIPLDGFDQ